MKISTKVYMQAEDLLDPSFVTCDDDLIMMMVESINTDEFHGIQDENVIKFFKWLNEEKNAISRDGLADFYDTDLWTIIGFERDDTGYVTLDHLEDNGWLVFDMSMDIDEERMMEFMVENSNLTMGGYVPFIFDEEELPKVKLILDNIEWDVSEEDFESAYDDGDGEMADWIEENDYTEEVEEWDEQDKIDKYKEYIADTCGDPDSNIVWYDEGNDLEIEIPCIPIDNAKQIAQMFSDGIDRNNFYWEHINDVLYERFGIRAVGFDVEAPEEPIKATEYENLDGELDQIISGLKSVFEETISDFKVLKGDYSDTFYANAITDCLEHQDILHVNIKEPYCKNGAKEVLLSLYDQQTDGWNVVVEADFGNNKNNKLEELYKTNQGYNERTFDEAREIFNRYSKVQLPSLVKLVEISKDKPMQSMSKADDKDIDNEDIDKDEPIQSI